MNYIKGLKNYKTKTKGMTLGSGHKVSAIWGWTILQKSSKKINGPS